MSHIVKLKVRVTNIDALAAAAEMLGCELVKQSTHYWYGGNTRCDYALKLRADSPFRKAPWSYGQHDPYELGVIKATDSEGEFYELIGDPHMGGYGLMWALGSEYTAYKDGNYQKVPIERDGNGVPTNIPDEVFNRYGYPTQFDALREEYSAQVAAQQLRAEGYSVSFGWNEQGEREVYAEMLAY